MTDRDSPPSTPRWVKVFGIVALALVVLVVILQVVGGGRHGPGRHTRAVDWSAPAIVRAWSPAALPTS